MSRASASGSGSWLHHLPFVLLGMRTSVREDSQCSAADLLYGSPVRLPGDMLAPSGPSPSASDFALRLRAVMSEACPMPVSYHGTQPSRVDPGLAAASHVFLRVDAVRRPLVPPYLGPFRVLQRGSKTFNILQGGKSCTVTVDRLKPAYVSPSPLPPTPPAPPSAPPPSLDPESWPLPTRYGRRPRPPDRLNL